MATQPDIQTLLGNITDTYRPQSPSVVSQPAEAAASPSDWTLYEAGRDFLSTFYSVIGNLSGAAGTAFELIDDDADTSDWQSAGSAMFRTAQDLLSGLSKATKSDRIKVTQDEVLEGLKNGDFMPSLLYIRDEFPNAAAYFLAAIPALGAPLFVSETERTLTERMNNQGLTNKDATFLDIAASALSAVINVGAERLPYLKPAKKLEDAGLLRVSLNAIKRDLGWEAAGGASEEILTKIGTDVELKAADIGKQAFFEVLGGMGMTPVTVGGQVAQHSNMKSVKRALDARKDEIVADLEQQLENAPNRIAKIRINREIKKVKNAKNLTKLNVAYPTVSPDVVETPDTAGQLGEEADVDATPTQEGEGVRDQEGTIVTPVEGGPSEIEVPAFGVLENVDPNDLPPGVTIKDGKLTIEIGGGRAEPTLEQETSRTIAERADAGLEAETAGQAGEEVDVDAQTSMPEILPRRDEAAGVFVGEQPIEGEYDMPQAAPQPEPLMPRMSRILERGRERRAEEQARIDQARGVEMPTIAGEQRAQERARAAAATEEDIALTEEIRRRAEEGARSEEPVIETGLGGTTLTNADVEVGGEAVRRARRRAQGIPETTEDADMLNESRNAQARARRRAQGIPETSASPTLEDLRAFEQERLARMEAEQADAAKQQAEQERTRREIDDRQAAREAESQARQVELNKLEAEDRAYRFITPYLNVDDDTPIRTIKAMSDSEAEAIGRELGPEARSIFRKEVDSRIKDLRAEREADARERAATQPTVKATTKPEPAAEAAPEPKTGKETFETTYGVEMDREYTVSNDDMGMSKSEFDRFNTKENGVVPDYFIEVMAEKRLAGDSFNKYEEAALTWPGVAEQVAQAEGRRIEAAEADTLRNPKALRGRNANREFARRSKKAPTPSPTEGKKAAEKAPVKPEKKEATEAKKEPEKAEEKAAEKAPAKEPSKRQKNRAVVWREKKDGSISGSLNGYPATIRSTDAENVYNVTYQGETVEFTGSLDSVKNSAINRFGSDTQKSKLKSGADKQKIANLQKEIDEQKVLIEIEKKAIADVTAQNFVVNKAIQKRADVIRNDSRLSKFADNYLEQARRYAANRTVLNTGQMKLTNLNAELSKLQGKKPAKGKQVEEPKGSKEKYSTPEELPNLPGKMGLIKKLKNPLEAGKPYQTYVDGEPFKASSSRFNARNMLNRATQEELDKIYQRRVDKAAKESTAAEREASRISRARERSAATTAKQQGKVSAAEEGKAAILAEAKDQSIGKFTGRARISQTIPGKSGDKNDKDKRDIVPSVKQNYHLSERMSSAGYDVAVQYKGKGIEIVYFSAADLNDARRIADSAQQQPFLFYEYITDQIENDKAVLAPVDVVDNANEILAAQRSIDRINAKSKKDKKPLTDEQKATIADYKKQIKNLQSKPQVKYALVPSNPDQSLQDWFELLLERGVMDSALIDNISGQDVADIAYKAMEEGEAGIMSEDIDEYARAAQDIEYGKAQEEADAQREEAEEEAAELKKKEIAEVFAEEKDVVEDIQSLSDQFLDDYTLMMDMWESGEKDTVLLTLNNTKKNGGMSLGDLKKLAESIESQESSFQLYPDKYFKSKEGVDYRDKKKKPSKSTYVLAITEWLNSDQEIDTSYIEDESNFIVDDDDLGWGDSNIKESRSATPEKGFESPVLASNALMSEMNDIWGSKATKRMMDIGFIKLMTYNQVVSSSQRYKQIKKETNAFVDAQDGSVVFIIDNIANNTNDIRGLILHELGVHYGKNILSDREFAQVLDQIYKLHRAGDEVVVDAVNAVLDNYYGKGTSLPELRMGAPAKNIGKNGEWAKHENNSSFWEEVLAHVIQFKAADIKPSLWNKITKAFNRFFAKILKPFDRGADPEVSVDDIVSLVQYSVGRVPAHALKTYDGAAKDRLAIIRRNKFLKESKVKDLVYHGSLIDFTAPVLEKTELGLHVGTLQAAVQRLEVLTGSSERSEDDIVYSGYVNIKNPLELPDVSRWNMPVAWKNAIDNLDLLFHDGLDGPLGEEILNIVNEFTRTDKVLKIYGKDKEAAKQTFASKIRKAILDAGYDSIKYTNLNEDTLSTSYILLNDGQFKSEQSILYDEKAVSIFESRGNRIIRDTVQNTQAAERGRSIMQSSFKAIQKYIEPLMTVNEYKSLEEARMLMKGEKEKYANLGRVLNDVLRNAKTPAEKRALQEFFETRDASPNRISNRRISYAPFESVIRGTRPGPKNESQMTIREGAVRAKRMIEDLGERLVNAGVLDRDQFEGLRGKYLPRVYLEFVMKGQDKIGSGFMTGSMGYTRARKDEESVIQGLISGRIKDPAYLASRYISMAGTDLATIDLLNFIASAPLSNGWVIPNQIMEIDGVRGSTFYFKELSEGMKQRAAILRSKGQAADANATEAFAGRIDREIARRPEIANVDTKKYKKVPNSVRYGAMRGLYLDKRIWDDIVQQGIISSQNEVLNSVLRFASKAQKTFKYTHVPMQIPAQSRNAISNLTLLNSSGVPIYRIPSLIKRSINEIINNGRYMELARKYGIETTTFSSEELGSIDKQLAQLQKDEEGMTGFFAKTKLAMDQFNVFGRMYQKTEVLFKIAKLIDGIERVGLSEAEAAMKANEALLDYGNVSPLLRTLRSMPLGSPFITFNAKALTQIMRNVKEHPVANLKFIALPYLMAEMFMAQFDDIDDEELEALKKFVPEYAEGNMNVFFLPYKDDNGKWVAFDMSYFLPWGAHYSIMKDIAKGELGEAWKTVGIFGGPVQGLISGMQNIDPFTGQEIWNESDPASQQAQDIMMFMASYMLPPMILPRNKSGDISAGGGPLWKSAAVADLIDGNIGKDGLAKYGSVDAALSWFGINTIKIGPYEMQNKYYWKQREIDDIISRAYKVLQDPNLSPAKRQDLYEEYRLLVSQKYLELQKWSEMASKVPL